MTDHRPGKVTHLTWPHAGTSITIYLSGVTEPWAIFFLGGGYFYIFGSSCSLTESCQKINFQNNFAVKQHNFHCRYPIILNENFVWGTCGGKLRGRTCPSWAGIAPMLLWGDGRPLTSCFSETPTDFCRTLYAGSLTSVPELSVSKSEQQTMQ